MSVRESKQNEQTVECSLLVRWLSLILYLSRLLVMGCCYYDSRNLTSLSLKLAINVKLVLMSYLNLLHKHLILCAFYTSSNCGITTFSTHFQERRSGLRGSFGSGLCLGPSYTTNDLTRTPLWSTTKYTKM